MGQIIGLKFSNYRPIIFYKASPYVVNKGDHVLIKSEEGLNLGLVVAIRNSRTEGEDEDLMGIFRLGTEEDLSTGEDNKRLESEAFSFCRTCIQKRQLDMKLVEVEVFFDKSKMIFYFTAPGRIDFRELVKDLVQAYRTRIELRQIGVRHETQMLGAIGNCGQVCCCRRFLRQFEPVTIKMAKDQNLFLNPAKISGACGRLLCCLAYEKDTYTEFKKNLPKMGKWFYTTQGKLRTLRANIFRNAISVLTENNEEKEINLDEWPHILLPDPSPEQLAQMQAGNESRQFSPPKRQEAIPVKSKETAPKRPKPTGTRKLRPSQYQKVKPEKIFLPNQEKETDQPGSSEPSQNQPDSKNKAGNKKRKFRKGKKGQNSKNPKIAKIKNKKQ